MLDQKRKVKLKHELTEICLIKILDEIRNYGITTMCGPFFLIFIYFKFKFGAYSFGMLDTRLIIGLMR